MTSQFDPFATHPSDGDNAVTTTTMTTPQVGGMTAASPLVGKNIQFKSSLQAKQDAIKAQQEKEQQQILMQQQQQRLLEQQQLQQRDAFSSLGNNNTFTTPIHDSNGNFGVTSPSGDEDDPFAGLSCMTMTSSNAKKQTVTSDTQKNDDEDNSDDDRQIPFPEDPVLYQAQEAALYAEELLKEQASKNRGDKALNQLWNNAQGLFKFPAAPTNNTQTDETNKKETTISRTGEIPKPQQYSMGATQVMPVPGTPSVAVPFPGAYNVPNHHQAVYDNNAPSQASYANAPSPMVVPVPRPANQRDLDPDGVPWYARTATTTNNPQHAVSNDQQHNVPWYARSPPPDGLNVSVADVEYSGSPGSANDKVPWYSRGNPAADSTPSHQVRRSSSPPPSNKTGGGIGSGVGASVLGGVVGLVTLGPLAAVAAAGGLAYASAKDGMVGDVVRGAGGVVATAMSTAASATKKKNHAER